MHSAVKLIIGVIIALAGLYWYAADYFGPGFHALSALKTVFIGVFGLLLLFAGIIVVWIEWEDLKWQRHEKTANVRAKKRK